MTVNELIKKLEHLKPEIKEKHIQIEAPNGIVMNPEIKFVLKDKYDALNLSVDNINYLIITS